MICSSDNEILSGNPYVSYAYPHKTAYRRLDPPIALSNLWASEDRKALFLYIHVPFCETRCGYCNLLTLARPGADLRIAYLEALHRQARQVQDALGTLDGAAYARFAIGGGTPTYLGSADMARLFDLAEHIMGADLACIPTSVETSPPTATPEKLRLLKARGADRVSIGVQSFVEAEVAAAGRRQTTREAIDAVERIRRVGFATLNIDLIYGLPGQTVDSWRHSLRTALAFEPEELYIYPLYVRPLTGLGNREKTWRDIRLACYRAGRSLLLDAGYRQLSMRMFRAESATSVASGAPRYTCQENGMVGLGCGARSYTRTYHYSSAYAVSRPGVRGLLVDYAARPAEDFRLAYYGFWLDAEEQHRRYIIKSLLRAEGLSLTAYNRFFGIDPFDDLPELTQLLQRDLATRAGDRLRLTPAGLERTDAIGPWLYSNRVHRLIAEHELR